MTRKTRLFLYRLGPDPDGWAQHRPAGLLRRPADARLGPRGRPDELKYVPASAAVVAYANVRDVMASDFRQKLRQVLPDHDQKGQEEFQRETGINIEQDIDYVLAWMSPNAECAATG